MGATPSPERGLVAKALTTQDVMVSGTVVDTLAVPFALREDKKNHLEIIIYST